MLPLYKTVARSGAIIGFCGGVPAAALLLLILSFADPDPPLTLLFFMIFVACFSLFTLITGVVTAICACYLVLRAQRSHIWQRMMIGDAGIILVRWLESRGHNRQVILGGLIGARTGCIAGGVLSSITLTLALLFTGEIGSPMAEAIIWCITYIMAAVCALHGLPIGSMVVKEIEKLKPTA